MCDTESLESPEPPLCTQPYLLWLRYGTHLVLKGYNWLLINQNGLCWLSESTPSSLDYVRICSPIVGTLRRW